MSATVPLPPFSNEPLLELRRAPVRESLVAALGELEPRLPLTVPILVGEDALAADDFRSTDPGEPERVVATVARAGARAAGAAVAAGHAALPSWGARPATERVAALRRAAEVLRRRRLELASLEVRECAKPWSEADADVCEAIDFLEYYARAALELAAAPELLQVPGERNEMRYEPLGVVAVIAPWNFPLAIPAGMVGAALAAGNAAVLKPAEQSPACALALVEALREGGVPADAVALMPGFGDAGEALVRHPGVHAVAFTGSEAVGLEIVRTAAETPEDQPHVKRVVAEMGGKNCIIVDADADLDEAVPAIVESAFAYAGQKCSAAARVLTHEVVADVLLDRLAGAIAALSLGQAEDFAADVGPLIERAALERVEGYVELAARDGRIVAGGNGGALPAPGWFCSPTLVTELDPASPLLIDEIFGPVLAVERVPSVEAACAKVEALRFALTGGLFSRDPVTVAEVARRTPVGNLYVNRGITGARVGRQPFGGNRRSGVGLKTGGPNYLLQLVAPRVVCESTVRHGLVVE